MQCFHKLKIYASSNDIAHQIGEIIFNTKHTSVQHNARHIDGVQYTVTVTVYSI